MATKTNLITLVLIVQSTFVFGQITPHSVDSSLLPLALSMTQNAPRDSDKVVAICQWMFDNLEYDFETLLNDRKGILSPDSFQYPAVAIRRKKAVCNGYAQTFRDLCLLNNIYATVIVGYTAYNDLTDSAQILHAWNAVRIDNKWHLMDISWEDVALEFAKNRAAILKDMTKKNKLSPRERLLVHLNKKRTHRLVDNLKTQGRDAERIATANLSGFVDSTVLVLPDAATETGISPIFSPPATSYLFTPPHVFRTDHLPKDPLWQLTDSVISVQKFFFQQDTSVSPYFSTHFDYKKRLEELPKLDFLERERRELSRQLQFNPRDWMVVQNIAYDYTLRVHSAFQTFSARANSDETSLTDLQNLLTNAALYLTQSEGFHRMAGKISTGYAAKNMAENLAACEGYRQHIEQLWEWLKANKK
jgi:Transglutaminase-like superfamily